MSLPPFSPYHIPALLIGTAISLACIPPYFNPRAGILEYGLPAHIANSPTAYSPWILYTSRIHAMGVLILTFYVKGNFEAVDMIMSAFGVLGLVDAWVCVREGVRKRALERGIMGVACGVWGFWGGTGRGR
ncbi:hypothetical protein IQ06DRAFT_213126 [Phaeosphaeriaceae sp. SRC1lsM3a]|nr:hypothetical protein IQ06DRAFT_213126 [Stagonospora sp. SRC1lsM3a]